MLNHAIIKVLEHIQQIDKNFLAFGRKLQDFQEILKEYF